MTPVADPSRSILNSSRDKARGADASYRRHHDQGTGQDRLAVAAARQCVVAVSGVRLFRHDRDLAVPR